MKNSLMAVSIKETTLMENLKALVSIPGLTDSTMKDNGLMDSKKVKEPGKEPKEISTLVNGGWERPKALALISG